MVFSLDENEPSTVAKIKVIGVGGAGGNAVNRMVKSGLQGVDFISVNTDAMSLGHNFAATKIQIGSLLTHGLGAGAQPQVGMMSMQEDREQLRECITGADMIFIAAGMGGGTGTGAAPVVAELAREMGILTVAIVTKPFTWEGPVRERNAQAGLDALRRVSDTVIVVPNQKLLSIVDKKTPMREAFKIADEILCSATRGISDIILKPGDIQVDFADVKTIMLQGGDALMGTGRASGENKASVAADRAIHSPLLDNVNISGATGVLVNISGSEDLSLSEVDEAMNFIYEAVGNGSNTNIIFGTVINPELGDEIAITVIATGFGNPVVAKNLTRPAFEATRRPSTPPLHEPMISDYLDRTMDSRAKAAEEPATTKVPFGSRSTMARSGYTPSVRHEDPVPVVQESHADTSSRPSALDGLFGTPQRGRYSQSSPDVDYETPAFLRNQAD